MQGDMEEREVDAGEKIVRLAVQLLGRQHKLDPDLVDFLEHRHRGCWVYLDASSTDNQNVGRREVQLDAGDYKTDE